MSDKQTIQQENANIIGTRTYTQQRLQKHTISHTQMKQQEQWDSPSWCQVSTKSRQHSILHNYIHLHNLIVYRWEVQLCLYKHKYINVFRCTRQLTNCAANTEHSFNLYLCLSAIPDEYLLGKVPETPAMIHIKVRVQLSILN